jgi:hypothetical protein
MLTRIQAEGCEVMDPCPRGYRKREPIGTGGQFLYLAKQDHE